MKEIKRYKPCPFDTGDIELPAGLYEKIDVIACNVHEEWAKMRLDDGWKYGPVRDDLKKTHPCLVPYEDLPESEKDYDRQTAISTVKILIHMGFHIK
jgi:hypothetical protein